jgi:polyphosphate glucokinase
MVPSGRSARGETSAPRVLVVDVGGTRVKLRASGVRERRDVQSGPGMGPHELVAAVARLSADWDFEAVSVGYPGVVQAGRPAVEPMNLGGGWVGFDFAAAFGRPVKILNDAALQAVGGYRGGRMLFLGLGTGLGSALIADSRILPLELAHLPYRKGRTFEQYVGKAGRKRLGLSKWQKHVAEVVAHLRAALQADEVLLGGGRAEELAELPPGARLGGNEHAFAGGFLLFGDTPFASQVPEFRPRARRKA